MASVELSADMVMLLFVAATRFPFKVCTIWPVSRLRTVTAPRNSTTASSLPSADNVAVAAWPA